MKIISGFNGDNFGETIVNLDRCDFIIFCYKYEHEDKTYHVFQTQNLKFLIEKKTDNPFIDLIENIGELAI